MNDRPTFEKGIGSTRATRAVIDLRRIHNNVGVFRSLVGPDVKLMAVVKANGYGHGAIMVARTASASGVDYLGVATVDEGVQLRLHDLTTPILVLGPVESPEIPRAMLHDLELAVGSKESVQAFSLWAANCENLGPLRVHLKIDTGMRRFGCPPGEAPALAKVIAGAPQLRLISTFTHFASADEGDESPTLHQQALFESALSSIIEAGVDPGIRHAANSAATLRSRRYDYDMVRIGISLYGIAPSTEIGLAKGLKPALSIRSKIGRVIELALGDRVSYGGTYQATSHERAALIPIGYADGYRRGLSGKAWMGTEGGEAQVLGRVCMDQTVIRLPQDGSFKEGDEIVVAGDAECCSPSLDDLAEIAGTIPYEIATGIARRVPRIYVEDDMPIAVEDLHGLREIS